MLLAHSILGLWFRILPVDGYEDDICAALGVSWKVLLPLLVKCGLVRCRVTSTVKDIEVDQGQWDELSKAVSRSMRMEVTIIRTKLSERSYSFCIDVPRL